MHQDIAIHGTNGEAHAAWQSLFRELYTPLTWFAARILNGKDPAEDIVMDAFVKIWYVGSDLNNVASSRSFLYSTVRNACIDAVRRQKRKNESELELAYLSATEDRYILEDMIRAELVGQLQNTLNTLPPKCREIFRLFYLEDKSIKEIATELNLSVNTIKTQKRRAMELLKQRLPYLPLLFLFITAF